MPKQLTIKLLRKKASAFAKAQSKPAEPSLFGVTDGKAAGTYLEYKFQTHLHTCGIYGRGNSAKGIDFPERGLDNMDASSGKRAGSAASSGWYEAQLKS